MNTRLTRSKECQTNKGIIFNKGLRSIFSRSEPYFGRNKSDLHWQYDCHSAAFWSAWDLLCSIARAGLAPQIFGTRNAKPSYLFICSWTTITQNMVNKAVALTFDLADDDAQLSIGLDVQQYSKRDFTAQKPVIMFLRNQETSMISLPIYTQGHGLNNWTYVYIIRLRPGSKSLCVPESLFLSAVRLASYTWPNALAKQIHHYTHAPRAEMVYMLELSGCPGRFAAKTCAEIGNNCLSCQRSGTPTLSRKILQSHTCEQFHSKIQTDYMFVTICSTEHFILHIFDSGTDYSETAFVNQQSAESMATVLESIWSHQHGTPFSFSADWEFIRGQWVNIWKPMGSNATNGR